MIYPALKGKRRCIEERAPGKRARTENMEAGVATAQTDVVAEAAPTSTNGRKRYAIPKIRVGAADGAKANASGAALPPVGTQQSESSNNGRPRRTVRPTMKILEQTLKSTFGLFFH